MLTSRLRRRSVALQMCSLTSSSAAPYYSTLSSFESSTDVLSPLGMLRGDASGARHTSFHDRCGPTHQGEGWSLAIIRVKHGVHECVGSTVPLHMSCGLIERSLRDTVARSERPMELVTFCEPTPAEVFAGTPTTAHVAV